MSKAQREPVSINDTRVYPRAGLNDLAPKPRPGSIVRGPNGKPMRYAPPEHDAFRRNFK
jgi:hypothetical protein